MDSLGHPRVRLVAPGDSPHTLAWVSEFRAIGTPTQVCTVPRGRPRIIKVLLVALRTFFRRPPEVTVIHSLGTHGLLGLLVRRSATTVAIPWGSDVLATSRSRLKEVVARRVLARADLIIVQSDWFRDEVVKRWPDQGPKINVIAWGVDTKLFTPPTPREVDRLRLAWGMGPDEVVVLSPRGYTDLYRPALIIDAFGRASALRPALRLVMAGSTRYGAEQFEHARQQAATMPQVRMLGWITREEMAELCKVADAVVSLPVHDHRSRALVEALATGAHIIAAKNLGNLELQRDGAPLSIVSTTSPDELSEAFATLERVNPQQREPRVAWVSVHEDRRTQMTTIRDLILNVHLRKGTR